MASRVWKSVYCKEGFQAEMHDAICELINAHPEWDGDIDVEWDTVATVSCDNCGNLIEETDIEVGEGDTVLCPKCAKEEKGG